MRIILEMEKEMKTCGRGRYEIGRKLGSGAFGIIRLGNLHLNSIITYILARHPDS